MIIKSKSKKAFRGVSPRVIRVILLLLAANVVSAQQGVLRIASFDDLRRIGRSGGYPLSGNYELVCDIDASSSRDRPFEPIGGAGAPFTGRFYGRGGAVFVIRNLYISKPSAGHVGLFGVVGYGAEVSGVGVAAVTVAGGYAVGALAGANNGRIANCFGSGVVAAGRAESDAGGLVGVNGGGVYGSYSTAEVYGVDNVGGLVGLLRATAAGEVRQCFALGGVSGSGNVGGLVGQVFGGRVVESFSAGRVSGKVSAGGLIGRDFAVSSSWSDRGVFEVDGEEYYIGAAEVSGSYWDVEASGRASSAGGKGRGAAEMRSRKTFAGWDFGGVWGIGEGVGYPQLTRMPLYTRRLVYAVDGEGCGRLRVSAAGGVVELFGYGADVMFGAEGAEVAAEAWDGCRFAGWSDGSMEARRVDAALRDAAFTAKFEFAGGPGKRVYKYASGVGGMLRVSGVSGLAAGVDTAVAGAGGVVVAAVPDGGYHFAGWSDGFEGVARSDGAPADVTPMARFVENGRRFIEVLRYDDLYLIGRYDAYPLDAHYELVRDIEIPVGGGLEPIGSQAAPFTGVFRGNGYRISGLDVGRGGQAGDFRGLFGYADGADIRGVRVSGSAAGGDAVGMLVGMCVNTVIDSCGAAGAVRGRSGVGGLAGRSVNSLISRAYSTASVDGSGTEVGGLVGGSAGSFLARCYSVGDVSGAGYVGGAVGRGVGGQIQECYAVGNVGGGEGVSGGFIGYAGGGVGVLRSYSAGYVAGIWAGSGGFAGTLGGGGSAASFKLRGVYNGKGAVGGSAVNITDCYWDIERSTRPASAGGVGVGTAEMALKGTYAGWDFEEVWDMGAGGYPRLRGLEPDSARGVSFEQRRGGASVVSADKPLVRVVGKAVYVNAPKGELIQIRVIDMRGKTVARHNVVGAARLSIDNKAASGRYIVEARRRGGREGVWSMRVFK